MVPTRMTAGYDAAADLYDAAANRYWDRFSRRTLEHLAPRRGARILDAGCGSGAFALPAATAVGRAGCVVGVDLSHGLLALARSKAKAGAIANVSFVPVDFMDIHAHGRGFDAVVSVFSIFFVDDLRRAVEHLWSLVQPGGTLAITTWGDDLFEPASSMFWRSIAACRPALVPPQRPWDRLTDGTSVRGLLEHCGAGDIRIVHEHGEHALHSATDWWDMVLGSGFRATVEQLTESERDRVKHENLDGIRMAAVGSVRADVVYALGRKPARNVPAVGRLRTARWRRETVQPVDGHVAS